MNKYESSEFKYAEALLQLQHSLNNYLDSVQQLIETVNNTSSLDDHNKKRVKKSISTTISTLLEVQKIIYKKIQILMSSWDLGDNFIDAFQFELPNSNCFFSKDVQIANKNREINTLKKFHHKKETRYKLVIYYEEDHPAPPWISSTLK